MSYTRVKMKYEEEGCYGSTEIKTLYCEHNHSCDHVTFYNEKGEVPLMSFGEWSNGKDLWDAMITLYSPFKERWGGELKDGVEYYRREEIKHR